MSGPVSAALAAAAETAVATALGSQSQGIHTLWQ